MSPPFPFMHVIFFFLVAGLGALFLKASALCGNETGVCVDADLFGYPFSKGDGDCGYPGLTLSCSNVESRSLLNISNSLYYILDSYPGNQMLRVVGVDVEEEECPRPMHNFTLPTTSPFSDPYKHNPNITYFYHCSSSGYPKDVVQQLPCLGTTATPGLGPFVFSGLYRYYNPDSFNWFTRNCHESVVVPVKYLYDNSSINPLLNSLKEGFYLGWSTPEECKDCEKSGGQCWFNHTTACSCLLNDTYERKLFDSVCPHIQNISQQTGPTANTSQSNNQTGITGPTTNTSQSGPTTISHQTPNRAIPTQLKFIILGVCSGVGGLLLVMLFICRRRLSSLYNSTVSKWKSKINSPTNVEAFLESCGCLALQKYRYSEVKKMTNNFKEKLGQGGFGSVFKGKLSDGSLVAVKVLNVSKGNGQDFINEVATIGWTNHVNVVRLLGFCCDGNKQALVYEFMVNGSLEKFIYDRKNASIENPSLGCEKLYQIALGIANGLEYLHCGCNTRILHFDIKPHNILLDQDFCPKISDFGLAKLCQTRESNVSIHVPRGTVGYIAPEISCINFGRASHKSDVYSYGMMIFEMIAGRKNIDVNVDNTSEIYYPQWIYNHFKRDIGVDGTKELYIEETTRKMIIIALWCIQTKPFDRPSICEVVKMFEGSMDELQMPRNPFQGSPSRSSP